jgi:hypothetical protein
MQSYYKGTQLLFVRKTTMKAMSVPSRKCARGKKFAQHCTNICGNTEEVLGFSLKREVCPAQ